MPNKLLAIISEEDLVTMIIAADQEAFEFLYDKYNQAVFGLLVRITNDVQQSETLLVKCFATIRQNIGNFNAAESRLFTWISQQVRRVAFGGDKEMKENKIHIGNKYVRENGVSTHSTERTILEMVMFEGYGYDELSTIRGVSREEIGIIIRREMNQMKKNFK